jgi:hypothetical protein
VLGGEGDVAECGGVNFLLDKSWKRTRVQEFIGMGGWGLYFLQIGVVIRVDAQQLLRRPNTLCHA